MISKKGSLNLSIQAIVILVMAMAVLGLGLGFIRTLMGQSQDQFEEAIGAVELVNPPSAADPFVVDANIKVKSTGEGRFKAGVYNGGTFSSVNTNDLVTITVNQCTPSTWSGSIKATSQQIPIGEYAGYKAIMDGGSTTPGVYICQIRAYNSARVTEQLFKQVEITVTN